MLRWELQADFFVVLMDFSKVFTLAFISLMGAMSPGPDFAIVTKNSFSGSFRSGFLTALGVASALLVHVTYCLFGIAVLIQESPFLFEALRYLGAAYLFCLGVLLLKEKTSPEGPAKVGVKKRHSPFIAGFLCNLLNPKATLFVLSLFSQFIDPTMSFWAKGLMGSVIAVVCLAWFSFLSFLITHRLLQKHFARFQLVITKTMGVVLCLLGILVVLK